MAKKVSTFKCDICKKLFPIERGIEHGVQYGMVQIDEMTYPWTTSTTVKHYARICKKCLNKFLEELNREEVK